MIQNISSLTTDSAPKAIGPYSQAIRGGDFLFCSGQIPLDPKTMQVVEGDIRIQTERVCLNLEAILKKAGLDFSRVIKTTCYLKNMNDFQTFNDVYEKFFGKSKPARATVEVARLPKEALIEIECIAAF